MHDFKNLAAGNFGGGLGGFALKQKQPVRTPVPNQTPVQPVRAEPRTQVVPQPDVLSRLIKQAPQAQPVMPNGTVVDNRPMPMRVPNDYFTEANNALKMRGSISDIGEYYKQDADKLQTALSAPVPNRDYIQGLTKSLNNRAKELTSTTDNMQAPASVINRQNALKVAIGKNLAIDQISQETGLAPEEIKQYTDARMPGYKAQNPFEAVGSFIGDTVGAAAGIVRKPVVTLDTALDPTKKNEINATINELNSQYKTGRISKPRLQQQFNSLLGDQIGAGLKVTDNGIEQMNDMEAFLQVPQQALQQGVDTSNVLPVANAPLALRAAMKAGAPAREIIPALIKTNAQQAAVLGTATTANDAAQGNPITPQSIAMNYGAPLALGVAMGGAGAASGKAIRGALNSLSEARATVSRDATKAVQPAYAPTESIQLRKGTPEPTAVASYKTDITAGKDIEPVYVTPDKNGRMTVVDGNSRLQAARELGLTEVPTKVVPREAVDSITQGGFAKLPEPEARFRKNAKNAYKVVDNQKDISTIKASDTPELISFTKEVHNDFIKKHPDAKNAGFNQTLGYVRTLSIPDKVLKSTKQNRTNYVREVADRVNRVGVKPVNPDGKAYLTTSFLQKGEARNRALLEGPASPSSHLPKEGDRAGVSILKSTDTVPNNRSKVNTSAERIAKALDPNDPFKYGRLTPAEKTAFKRLKKQESERSSQNQQQLTNAQYSEYPREVPRSTSSQVSQPEPTNRSNAYSSRIYSEQTPQESRQVGNKKELNRVPQLEYTSEGNIAERVSKKQFATPNRKLTMTKGDLRKAPKSFTMGESQGGRQRKRLVMHPEGYNLAVVETRKPNGKWEQVKEPVVKSKIDYRGIDALEANKELTDIAEQAMNDGKQIDLFAEKNIGDVNGQGSSVMKVDPERHIIDGGYVRDARTGAILGNHIKVDDTGIAINIGKDMVNMTNIVGDPSKWKNMNKLSYTMDRILEKTAPDKDTYSKVRNFVIEHKQKAEGNMRVELKEYRDALYTQRKELMKLKPSGVSKKDFMTDIFHYAERKIAQTEKGVAKTQDQLILDKYGTATANRIKEFDNWSRKQYDSQLDRTNEVLRMFGHDEVPKRQNYMTHLQEDSFWDQIGIGEDLMRDLTPGVSGESNSNIRGSVSGAIAGRTENFKPTKKFNPFHQTRKGDASATDPFRAMDAYGEAAQFNIHMTEPAVRARSLESVFRAAETVTNQDMLKQVSYDLRKSLKSSLGGTRNYLVVAFQEYANALAGKSNRYDRALTDASSFTSGITKVSRALQKVASQSSIVGNASVTLAQTLNLPNVVGTNGMRSTIKGVGQMIADIDIHGNPRPDTPAAKSDFLKVRYTDAQSKIMKSGLQKSNDMVSKVLLMPQLERSMVQVAWYSSYEQALKKKFTGLRAIKEADRMAERLVAGRGIGDQPELYRSTVAKTFLQYTLEVNAALKNVRKDMTPAGIVKYAAAVFVMNKLMEQVTGRAPLPDFVQAGIDTYDDATKGKGSIEDKIGRAGQRFASEAAGLSPLTSSFVQNFGNNDTKKAVFGSDSDISRYDGTPAGAGVANKMILAAIDLFKRDPKSAGDNALSAVPYGSQIRKTGQGLEAINEGVARDSKGRVMTPVNQDIPSQVRAILFGKGAIPEVKAYYENKMKPLGDKQQAVYDQLNKTDRSAYLDQTLSNRTKASDKKDTSKTTAVLKAERQANISAGTWKEKNGLVVDNKGSVQRSYYKNLAESYSDKSSKEAIDAYSKAYDLSPDLDAKSTSTLVKFKQMSVADRKQVFEKESSAEYDYQLATYNDKLAKGEITEVEKAKEQKTLQRSKIGSRYSKEARQLYTMSKPDASTFLASAKNKDTLTAELVAYDKSMYDAGLSTYQKYRYGVPKPSTGKVRSASTKKKSTGRKTAAVKKGKTSVPKTSIKLSKSTSALNRILGRSKSTTTVATVKKAKKIKTKKVSTKLA